MSKKDEAPVTAIAVMLKDGPHRLSVPGWTEIERVQGEGFPVGVFHRKSERTEDVVAEALREARIAASVGLPVGEGEDRIVFTPQQVVDAIGAINPKFGVVADYGSIRAHMAALLIASEPGESWTDEKVSALMEPAKVYDYTHTLYALYAAAFPLAAASESGEG